jgi:hypothetical protein
MRSRIDDDETFRRYQQFLLGWYVGQRIKRLDWHTRKRMAAEADRLVNEEDRRLRRQIRRLKARDEIK